MTLEQIVKRLGEVEQIISTTDLWKYAVAPNKSPSLIAFRQQLTLETLRARYLIFKYVHQPEAKRAALRGVRVEYRLARAAVIAMEQAVKASASVALHPSASPATQMDQSEVYCGGGVIQ